MDKVKIFGFGGSLRKGSLNFALLQQASQCCPENATYELFNKFGDFPQFNADMEKDLPLIAKEFKAKIKAADAILIAVPEYNFSIPGYLKNAIDWASRPYGDNSFDDKPVAIMSASGALGGSRAQYHLRQTFVFLNMHPINRPECIVTNAAEKIKEGKVVDEHTIEKISELMEALVIWTKRLKQK
ncbi:MAG TPA: NAD(P)H-dependent oxidoreductase [Candidatus Saccharimonadales bacterium]|nr:NAD(P)H-dependent oxidoreductase [Candidatus Saccharimonadales bacterium]